MRDYDVIVVGGGCAGLWAARAAAAGGATTLVLERQGSIGASIRCAEGVGSKGISGLLDLDDAWVASRIDGGRFCAPDGGCVDTEEPECGFVLHKDAFLKGLAAMAESAGAEVRTGRWVTGLKRLEGGGFRVETGEGPELDCAALVAADGIASRVGRMAGLDTHISPGDVFTCVQNTVSPIDVNPHVVEFHFGRAVAPGGYAWVFPKGDGRANVGVGITRAGEAGPAMSYLNRFMAERCPGATVERSIAGGVPAVGSTPRAFEGGLFLAGDAARAADPVSGAGIVQAMESAAVGGHYAAAYALGDMSEGEVAREFAKKHDAVLGWRNLRYKVRKIFTGLTDEEFCTVVRLIGEYSSGGDSLQAPGSLLKFMVRCMPRNFGMLRHLAGV